MSTHRTIERFGLGRTFTSSSSNPLTPSARPCTSECLQGISQGILVPIKRKVPSLCSSIPAPAFCCCELWMPVWGTERFKSPPPGRAGPGWGWLELKSCGSSVSCLLPSGLQQLVVLGSAVCINKGFVHGM